MEILSFISTTRRSIGLTIKHDKKPFISKKTSNLARVSASTLQTNTIDDITLERDGAETSRSYKKQINCRFSYVDPNDIK